MSGSRPAERPYVDRPVPDRAAAFAAAAAWAGIWGVDAPRLLRHGMNSLYVCGDVVLRVGAATAPAQVSHHLVRWLLASGVPTLHPIEGLAADVEGLAVTGWELIHEVHDPVDWEAIGAAVRLVHTLPADEVPDGYPVPSPVDFAWWRFDEMLADVRDEIDAAAFDGLSAAVERRRRWPEMVAEEPVLCHGDVHPGNVVMSTRGALLLDWDLMCVANRAWDHAMMSTYADRWGGAPEVYDRFATGYGQSLAHDQLTQALAELRNVAATLMRVKAGRTDEAARIEADRRLRFWRGDPHAPVWAAQ